MTSDHGADRGGPGFDAALRRHRLRASLTQEELAAQAGIGVRTVRDLERGRSSRPQRTTVDLLARALGLHGRDRDDFLASARGASGTPPPPVVALPPPADLIGRDADVAELVARLSSPVPVGPRGVTLVGLAGVGKTALALVVAHRIAATYSGGVAGIVVTDGFTPGEVLGSVAGVFGVGRPDDLPARFADSPGMLLIDAVERAPESVASALSQLLELVPALRFLATGRHPVGLASEQVWPLAPLLAPGSAVTSRSEASAYPAVGLFLERLSRVRRAPVDDDEVAALVTLVRRLGGLPLAIELAAARGRVLTVAEILDRYGDRMLDLSGPPGDEVVTMRDAVAGSYRLLTGPEQAALRRLAIFRHRWSLALAEQMIDDGTDVVHLLDRLLELGLLSVRGSRTFRFRLLDVVRDYAAERAAEAGELTPGRRRHAVVFADLAVRTAPDLMGANLGRAAAQFDEVVGDLGSALSFAAGEDPHTALRLAAALPRWWRFRGRDVPGRRWLRRLLDDPRTAAAEPSVRAWAKVGLAQLAREHDAGAEELPSAESALADFERLGSVTGQLTALTQLVALTLVTGRYDESRRYAEAGLALARSSGRVRDMAVAENNLTWHEIRQGDLAAARRRLGAVERLATRSGEDRLRALAVANQAEVARLDGHPDDAIRLGRRALTELEGVGDPNHRRRVLATIGLALAETRRLSEAEQVYGQLRPAVASAFSYDGPQAVVEGAIAAGRGEGKRAAECFARAADAYEGTTDPRDLVTALVGLIISTPEADRRGEAVRRLGRFCTESGLTLLPRERDLLGDAAMREIAGR